jgi:hypothetical protein
MKNNYYSFKDFRIFLFKNFVDVEYNFYFNYSIRLLGELHNEFRLDSLYNDDFNFEKLWGT